MERISDNFLAGSLSGIGTRFLTAPLDVLKVRLQLQIEPISTTAGAKYRGAVHAAKTILKEEGVRGFWKGFLAGQLLYVIYSGTQFATYEFIKKSFSPAGDITGVRRTSLDFVSGCVAGGIATLPSFPFDVLRTRMISQGEPKVYPTLYRGVVMMYSESGLRTFYKGLTPALTLVVPQAGLNFAIFKLLCRVWEVMWSSPLLNKRVEGEAVKWAICGGLAGVSAKVIVLPFDTLKKRLEVQGFEHARKSFGRFQRYHGVLHCLVTIYKDEGILGFYKGTSPSIIKATVAVSASFTLYERILKYLRQLRNS